MLRIELAATEQASYFIQGALCGRQTDALHGPIGCTAVPDKALEPLQGQEQMRAALGRDHGVDLVDDHGLGAVENIPGF